MTTAVVRRAAAATLAATVVLALAGCTGILGSLIPGYVVARSTPTGETTSAVLEPYYSQVLEWSRCEGDFQCTTATAPLDWTDPSGQEIDLALIRAVATGDRLGSLLVNPGGPGGSGYSFVRDSLERAVSERVVARYDVVGFDPRGVGRSSAVDCHDDPEELDDYIYDIPEAPIGSEEYLSEIEQAEEDFGEECLENTGRLLGFVDTVSAARDLDLLRAVLGDRRLNYLGYSYGTLLGATYAGLFPRMTGRLVLDGAIDPTTTSFEVTAAQARGFDAALGAYLADCVSRDCVFSGTVGEATASVRRLLDRLEASPLRAADGRLLGSSAMSIAIILPLYNEADWPYLDQLFASVAAGDPEFAFQLADNYYGREPDGGYRDNSAEAFTAINCLDYAVDSTRESLDSEAEQLAAIAPIFGPELAYGGTSCAAWPFPSTRQPAPITAAGSAPIVVVGTTGDPATPYAWAQGLADQLENGHLVTYDGEGHTAYNTSNDCVLDAVDGFLIDGVVPAVDPMC